MKKKPVKRCCPECNKITRKINGRCLKCGYSPNNVHFKKRNYEIGFYAGMIPTNVNL